MVPSVPFEAFISPVQSRGGHVKNDHDEGKSRDKGKGKEIMHTADPFTSPTLVRPRASMGASASVYLMGSQRSKGRVSERARRESASAAFEAYIVRDSPKQTSGHTSTSTDTGIGMKPLLAPPGKPSSLEGPESLPFSSLSVVSPVVPDAVPVTVPIPAEVDRQAEDADPGDVCVDSVRVDDGITLDEGEDEPERSEEEPDEADTLLELASVHLSQPEAAMDRADKIGVMDVMDEVRTPCFPCLLALLRSLG